jgi:WD40 repeat protein
VAFDPSGRVMAQTDDRINLRLTDPATGDGLAVLQVPESQNVAAYQFSPDGRYLAAITVSGVVQLWDVRRLRHALEDLGLSPLPGDDRFTPLPDGIDPPFHVELAAGAGSQTADQNQ